MQKLIFPDEIRAAIEAEPVRPDIYYVPSGRILSPAAKDYLNRQRIRFDSESRRPQNEARAQSTRYLNQNYVSRKREPEKPEPMTHGEGGKLVMKDDPLIAYRGKLDSAQAQVVFVQSLIAGENGCPNLLADLDDVLTTMREVMRAEVTGEPLRKETILGLTHAELRAQSHDPEGTFHVPMMYLPNYELGTAYAGLNLLRTTVREAEVMAVHAFRDGTTVTRPDLIETLNRLSSAMHILMCRYQAGWYTRPSDKR